jgi:hypothetical protein
MKNHIKSNQQNLDYYNRMVIATQDLKGGGNYSPQNSGVIMANINLSEPIFDSRGYMRKNISFARSKQIRGEENVLTLLERVPELINKFSWMKITATKPAYFGGNKAAKWEWVKLTSKEDVVELIRQNKGILNKQTSATLLKR